MYCSKCGAQNSDKASYCSECGCELTIVEPSMQTGKTETSTRIPAPKRTSSFICSLLGYLLDILPFIGLILSIIGTVLAANGKKEVKRNAQKYSGTERLTAGLVLGIIGIVNSFIYLILELVCEESIIEMLSEL